jgi:copper oxidase (laccase) domain-containing protein
MTDEVGLRIVPELPAAGPVPRFEMPHWREEFGVVAGITGRGQEEGRGFDLGLWSDAPIGEVMGHWRALRRSLPGFCAVVLGHQVHGSSVARIDAAEGWIHREGIDGWVSTGPGILLTVTVADCIPIYLTIPGKAIALLHAGWRGTAGGILGAGLSHLLRAANATAGDVVMHCGVGICGACYEVGSEVMGGCGIPTTGTGPWHLDLRRHLAAQAKGLGIGRVSVSGWCSAHDRTLFYSHRASQGNDGRMVAYLGIAPL